MNKQVNLSNNLKKLSEIAAWFDEQKTVDVEQGLEKVKEAATLIKESKVRLKAIENEFEEIKKEVDTDEMEGISQPLLKESIDIVVTETTTEKIEISQDDIPF